MSRKISYGVVIILALGIFFSLYRQLADSWIFYDNSVAKPTLISYSDKEQRLTVTDSIIWHNIVEEYGNKRET